MAVSKVDAANQIENQLPQANIAGNVNFRNIIINGDMSIAQRGTSKSGITSAGYYTVDRLRTTAGTTGTWTQSQSTDVPTGQGFATSLKMDCTIANASLSPTSALQFIQRIEGQNVQYLKYGTSSAQSLTLSFWVKSNKTGTYIIELDQNGNSKDYSQAYTINSANTWEKKTLTFDGDTAAALANDNTEELEVNFWLVAGSAYTSGTLNTSWGTTVEANRAVGQVNLADTVGNEFYITGVQLEAGTTASDFEFLPYDVNFDRCQRYCQLITEGDASVITAGAAYTGTNAYGAYMFRKRMRAAPTFTQTTGTGYYRFRNVQSDEHVSSLDFENAKNFTVRVRAGGSMTAGHAGWFSSNNASAKILAEAEL